MIAHINCTVMDGLVVRWTFDPRESRADGEISASRNGVLIHNLPLIRTQTDRREFDETVSRAWDCYSMLARDAERFGSRTTKSELAKWLTDRGVRVVDVQIFESVEEALAREAP